jgi:hypothetical protein
MNLIVNLNIIEIDTVSGGVSESGPGLILLGPVILSWAAKALADAVREAQLSTGGTSHQ